MTNYSRLISRTIIKDDYISPDIKFPIQYVFSHFLPNNISHVNHPADKEISNSIYHMKYLTHSDTFSISLGVPNSNKDIMPGSNPPLSKEEYMKYLDDVLSS